MIKLCSETQEQLLLLFKERGVTLEGNILKFILSDTEELKSYIDKATEKDKENRRKRLEITKTVQEQNKELVKWKEENAKINEDLEEALKASEKAKEEAISDLDVLQKKTQNQLVESIVKVSLWIICGVGVITTTLFLITLLAGIENQIVQSAWSNMFGILLTNSFSIIGTIMGVKYAGTKSGKCPKCNK